MSGNECNEFYPRSLQLLILLAQPPANSIFVLCTADLGVRANKISLPIFFAQKEASSQALLSRVCAKDLA